MNGTTPGTRLSEDIEQAIAGYIECGYGVIRRLLSSDEIEQLVSESGRLWQLYKGTSPGNLRLGIRLDRGGQPILERLDPVADISEEFGRLNQDLRLTSIAKLALGEPVTVMKEKLTYKLPGTPGFGPHRDQDYNTAKCGVPGSAVVTVSVALDPANRANGAMEFFPSLRTRPLAAPEDEPRDVDYRELIGVDSCMPDMNPGDVILFDGQVPHRSGWNRSDHCRRTYMISYVPACYPDARSDYYAARLAEQRDFRRDVVAGPLFFR
jgi:hypothetical protein